MDNAPGVLIASQRVQRLAPVPGLKLLIDWEPRGRVFWRNLADLILARQDPPVRVTSRPARFWPDVFVPAGVPWSSFAEALLCQLLLVILFIWGQSRIWVPVKRFPGRDSFPRSITYYPPTSYRAAESRASSSGAGSPVKHVSGHQAARPPARPVRPEQKPALVTPPDIKLAAAKPPDFLGSHAVTPIVPFSATAGVRRNTPAGPSGAVAPLPQVDRSKVEQARRLALPQAAVAPWPDLGGPSPGRTVSVPNTGGLRIVPPPPSVQSAGNSGTTGRVNSLSTGPNVVPPAPSVRSTANEAGNARFNSMAGASQVVPPPPAISGGNSVGVGRLNSTLGAGPNVVHPPPSIEGASNADRDARRGSTTTPGTRVVPPPPSVAGTGNSSGTGRSGTVPGTGVNVVGPPPTVQSAGNVSGDARFGSMRSAGSQAVPPPPAVLGSGGPGGGSRVRSLSGSGSEVVAPAPSLENGSNAGASGRLGSLSGDGSPAVLPPASVEGSGGNAPLPPMEPLPVTSSQPTDSVANAEGKASIEELPLGFLGLVFAAPGSSYFSNFEVFVAKRRLGKELQLIKLVYEFLPYQKRLSEYDLNNMPPRIIKLRVIPDPSCNESLGQIIEPAPDPTRQVTEYPKLPPALSSANLDAVLPCYRTTATDFMKAMSRGK